MFDHVLHSFLAQQWAEGRALAAASDLLELVPLANTPYPPTHYLATFHCHGVMTDEHGQIGVRAAPFVVGIAFGPDHLRRVEPLRLVTWLGPTTVVHPNIRPPFVCLGRVSPGCGLVDLLYQVFEIITYHNWSSQDFLSAPAAEWARQNQQLFPVDRRALKRSVHGSDSTDTTEGGPVS